MHIIFKYTKTKIYSNAHNNNIKQKSNIRQQQKIYKKENHHILKNLKDNNKLI